MKKFKKYRQGKLLGTPFYFKTGDNWVRTKNGVPIMRIVDWFRTWVQLVQDAVKTQ